MSPYEVPEAIDILPFRLRDIACRPPAPGESHEQTYARLIQECVPCFADAVRFALIEIAELGGLGGCGGHTLVYCRLSRTAAAHIANRYRGFLQEFSMPGGLFGTRDFFFSDAICCARIRRPAAAQEREKRERWRIATNRKLGSPSWVMLASSPPRGLAHAPRLPASEESPDLNALFREYARQFSEKFLSSFPFALILLVPIVLDASSSMRAGVRHELGSVFVHLGCTQDVPDRDLLDMFSRIQLFWHRYCAWELLEKQRLESDLAMLIEKERSEEFRRTAELFAAIEKPLSELRAKLKDTHAPLCELDSFLSPLGGWVFGGERVDLFFATGRRQIEINDRVPPVRSCHEYNPSDPENCRELVAAVYLTALGQTADAAWPLWTFLRSILERPSDEKRALVNALVEEAPLLREDNPDEPEIKILFEFAKDWFHYPYKFGRPLPYSLLRFAVRSSGCHNALRLPDAGHFPVVALRPIDVIDALATLNEHYGMRYVRGGKDGARVRLEITFNRDLPHGSALRRLVEEYHQAVDARERGEHPRRGSMVFCLWQLFGRRRIAWARDSITCETDTARTALAVKKPWLMELDWWEKRR